MKTPPILIPALAALAGFALLATGCHSDHSRKTVVMAPTRPVVSPPPPAPAPVASPAPAGPAPAAGTNTPVAVAATTASEGAPTARVAPQPPELSPGVQALVDMVHAQVGETVLLEYVNSSTHTFELQPEDIVYLKDLGVTDEVVTAMLKRTADVQAAEAVRAAAEAAPGPAPADAAPAVEVAAAPPPAPSTYVEPVTRSVAPASPPPVAVSDNYFYSALSPYGSWLYIEPHGWCWQPTVAVVDTTWRPYLHGGRWVYTSSGWYWQSTYSWGWAPFHYGNWYASPACGWVWVPGSVWSPAWVTWRYSDAYCGWAPLPPGCAWTSGVGLTWYGSGVSIGFGFNFGWSSYSFCAWDSFWGPYPYRYCVPPHRAQVVYNNTTIINNYHVDNNNTVINNGVPPHAMPARIRNELRPVQVNDVTHARSSLKPERTSADGSRLAVYRPSVPPDLKSSSPTRTADQPYRPVRSRSESISPTRAPLTPERGLAVTPARSSSQPAVTPQRTPQRSVPGGTSAAPGRTVTPSRTTPVAPTPSRSAPAATTPSRSTPGVTQPSTPSRSTPPAQAAPAPGRSSGPAANPPSRATTPGTGIRSTPGRSEAPAPAPSRGVERSTAPRSSPPPSATPSAPSAPARSDRATSALQPSAPSRSGDRPVAPRITGTPAAPTTGGRGTAASAPSPNAGTSRYVAPSRSSLPPVYRSNPGSATVTPIAPSRSTPSTSPGFSSGRSGSAAPNVAPPASRPAPSAPAPVPSSPSRSMGNPGGGGMPSFSPPPGAGRSAPPTAPRSRGGSVQ